MNWQDEDAATGRLNMKMLNLFSRRLWPYVRRHRPLFFVSLALVGTATAMSLVTPWLLGLTVDHVLVERNAGLVIPFAAAILAADALGAAATYLASLFFTTLGQRVMDDLRSGLFLQYVFYPLREFDRTPAGRLVTRLVNDTSSLQELFTGGLAVAAANISVVAGIIVWLLILHPKLGIVSVSVFPVMILVARLFGARMRRVARESRAALSQLNALLAENISGMPLIQLFNKQPLFHDRFEEASHRYTRTQVRTIESFAYFQPAITILSSLSMSLMIWYGGFLSLREELSLGLLVAFMSYLHALYSPVRDLTEKYNLFVNAMTACERIFEFMDRSPEDRVQRFVEEPAAFRPRGDIEFRNVYFRYYDRPDAPWVIRNMSFTVKEAERIGIVGYTGAGKTTVAALLMDLYDLDRGEILIGGRSIRSIEDRRSLREAMALIQQEPFLFSGSVADNLFLWEPACEQAFLELPEFARAPFEKGPLWLDKEVLEKGANLSAGQRQMISFIRAMVRRPSVLILDEATAHMDPITEAWVDSVSETAFRSRTVLIIAHRLATLRRVDRIFVLHHGELVESGTHEELLNQGGIYKKLYTLQSRKEVLAGEDDLKRPGGTDHFA